MMRREVITTWREKELSSSSSSVSIKEKKDKVMVLRGYSGQHKNGKSLQLDTQSCLRRQKNEEEVVWKE